MASENDTGLSPKGIPISAEETLFGASFDLKDWKELLGTLGIALLLPGMITLWGYAFFNGYRPIWSGSADWTTILLTSLNLEVWMIIFLGMTYFVGGIVATICHLKFIPSKIAKGVPGFKVNQKESVLLFGCGVVALVIILAGWFFLMAGKLPLWQRFLYLICNLAFAYLVFRIWTWERDVIEAPFTARIWNASKPFLVRGALIFTLTICIAMAIPYGVPRHLVFRSFVLAGVRTEWQRLRIAGIHFESLKRKGHGKLDLNLVKEGDQTYIYLDQGIVFFQRIGTEAYLGLRRTDGKVTNYPLPLTDVRTVGSTEDSDDDE